MLHQEILQEIKDTEECIKELVIEAKDELYLQLKVLELMKQTVNLSRYD